jgi:hypothetical protein
MMQTIEGAQLADALAARQIFGALHIGERFKRPLSSCPSDIWQKVSGDRARRWDDLNSTRIDKGEHIRGHRDYHSA